MKEDSFLKIGGKKFSSRLMVGTGKYKSSKVMVDSLSNAESEIVTVAVRRVQNNQNVKIYWKKLTGKNFGCSLILLVALIQTKQ